jgi:flagellar basal-body rod protein FlgB
MAGFINNIFDRTLSGLQRQLDLTWQRGQAITSNIANAETPQYRAVDVNFGKELERAFERQASPIMKTNGKHMDLSAEQGSYLVGDLSGLTKPDGNNVDIDLQMGRLSSNSSAYGNAATLVKKKLSFIRNAIRDSGR